VTPDPVMKVVYLDHVAQLSGGVIALLRLLPHLDRVEPYVILAEHGPLIDELIGIGIPVEVLPLRREARLLRKDRVKTGGVSVDAATATAAYVLALTRRLRVLAPDIVHTNSFKAGVYGSLAARLAGVPVVWHVRDQITSDYLPPAAARLIRLMTRNLASAVVANSRSTMATLKPHPESLVLYSVLPEVTVASARRDATDKTGDLRCGVVERIAPWKGQDLVLRAFAQAFPSGSEEAVIVGGALFGEDDYKRRLVDLARARPRGARSVPRPSFGHLGRVGPPRRARSQLPDTRAVRPGGPGGHAGGPLRDRRRRRWTRRDPRP
jgi:glycosyltransferase involved in cell wall biosynthesis